MRDTQGRILPDFIIVGAMRGGTTTLGALLRSHPDCFVARQEIHFFDRTANWRQGLDWYSRRFREWEGQSVVGEKTPAYSYRPAQVPPVPERILDALPDVRLIWSLRDPVKRTYSQYRHAVMSGMETLPFERAIEERRRPDWRAYRDRSVYIDQVESFLRCFPRERMHVVKFEQMVADPQSVLAGVQRFLGLEVRPVPVPGTQERNAGGVPRSALLARLGARLHWDRAGGPLALLRRLNSARTGYPPMSAGTREALAAFFKPHNEALASRIGFDISGWGESPARVHGG